MPRTARQRWRERRQARRAQRQGGGRSQMGAAGAMLGGGRATPIARGPQQGHIRPGIARRDSLRSMLGGGRPARPVGTPMQAQQLPLEVPAQQPVGGMQAPPQIAQAMGGILGGAAGGGQPMQVQPHVGGMQAPPQITQAMGGAGALLSSPAGLGGGDMRARILQMLQQGRQQRPPQMGVGGPAQRPEMQQPFMLR